MIYKTAVPRALRSALRRTFDNSFCRDCKDKGVLGGRCPWTILKRNLHAGSIIYSGGVGEDISFELELIDQFGVAVHLFDPSPMALETLSAVTRHQDKLCFKPLGLAGSTKPMSFARMDDCNSGLAHWRKETVTSAEIQFPCTSVLDEMRANRHTEIDLLKIDIEGFEYEVLESCLADNVLPKQICVEFHHFLEGMPSRSNTAALLWRLYQHGYVLVHKNQYDYTFYRREYL